MTVLDDARAMADDLADLRHRLHRRPEIGLRLQQTQRTVLEALDGLDLEISTGIELGSVTAVVRGSNGQAREGALSYVKGVVVSFLERCAVLGSSAPPNSRRTKVPASG